MTSLHSIGSFLEKMAENSESVYWLSSTDFTKIEYVSGAFEKIWGRPRETIYQNPELWISYLHPEDSINYHPIHEMRERVALEGDEARYAEDYRIIRPNGEIRWIIDRGFPIIDEEGNCLGVTGVAVDITAEKIAEQLKLNQELAERKSHALSIAAGSIAHDLRTPLSSIRLAISGIENYFETILTGYKLALENNLGVEAIRPNKLAVIETALTRSKSEIDFTSTYIDLILNNLKYDQLNTNNYQHHNIITAINNALEVYPCTAREKQLVHWQPQADFDFWGNDLYLKNVLNNLLRNSFAFIKQERRGEIFIWTEQNENFNVLVFKDTALGAPPEVLEHMFDGYFSTQEGGTGLGMVFCKSIMQSFGGYINVESVFGEYIKFSLNFPVNYQLNEV